MGTKTDAETMAEEIQKASSARDKGNVEAFGTQLLWAVESAHSRLLALEAKPAPGMRTVSEEDWRAMVAVARWADNGAPLRLMPPQWGHVRAILAKEPK